MKVGMQGRWAGVVAAALMLGLMGSALPARAAQPANAAEPFDLASVALTTGDLEAAGFEDFRLSSATVFDLDADVFYLADALKHDPEALRETLVDAGYGGSYWTTHSLYPGNNANETQIRDVQVSVFVFADAEGAEAAYALLTDERATATGEDVPGAEDLGDAAELTRYNGASDAVTGEPFEQLELQVLVERLVLGVSLLNYGDDAAEPAVDEALALAPALIERAEAALAGNTAELYQAALMIDRLANNFPYVAYMLLDEEPVRLSTETDEAFAERVERWLNQEARDVLRVEQVLGSNFEEFSRHYNTLLLFPDEDAASAYVQGAVDLLAASAANLSAEAVDAPTVGDESVVVAANRAVNGDPFVLYQLFARVGEVVSVSWIEDASGAATPRQYPFEALVELGEAQAACLEAGVCDEVAPVPAALTAAPVDPGATEEPEEPVDPAATQEPGEPGADEANAYTSEALGISITWGDDWTTVGETTETDLTLDNGISEVWFSAFQTTSLDECLSGLAALESIFSEGFEPALGADGEPLAGGNDERAYRVFIAEESLVGGDWAVYIECRDVGAEATMLGIVFQAPIDQYNEQTSAYRELIANLEVDGE